MVTASKFFTYLWFALFALFFCVSMTTPGQALAETVETSKLQKPKFVKGIHLTCWVAGSKKARQKIDALLNETELNTVVIAVKEYQGEVYIPGVAATEKYHSYVKAMPDIREYLKNLKSRGVYTIARVVVFKDKMLPAERNDLAVRKSDGSLWKDHKGNLWVDPYNKEVWDYNIAIASQAAALGFDEIQFDYIRYPSDGNIKECRYSYAQHNSTSASKNLIAFLQSAAQRLKPLGVNISIDVFGLTPSVDNDMGIGQIFVGMTQPVDFVSPMVYPSHYAKWEYGIADPNLQPYKTVHKTMSDALRRMGDMKGRLRPYLQDFSLGSKYGPKEVRAQIQACEDLGIQEWLLWSPSCKYQRKALRSKEGRLDPAAELPATMTQPLQEKKKSVAVSTNVSTAVSTVKPTKTPNKIFHSTGSAERE